MASKKQYSTLGHELCSRAEFRWVGGWGGVFGNNMQHRKIAEEVVRLFRPIKEGS